MSTIVEWSDFELHAELDDLIETRGCCIIEHERLNALFAERLARTVGVYGPDRHHWPASSWFHVTEVEGEIKALDARMVEVDTVIAEYRAEITRRGET